MASKLILVIEVTGVAEGDRTTTRSSVETAISGIAGATVVNAHYQNEA